MQPQGSSEERLAVHASRWRRVWCRRRWYCRSRNCPSSDSSHSLSSPARNNLLERHTQQFSHTSRLHSCVCVPRAGGARPHAGGTCTGLLGHRTHRVERFVAHSSKRFYMLKLCIHSTEHQIPGAVVQVGAGGASAGHVENTEGEHTESLLRSAGIASGIFQVKSCNALMHGLL